MARVAARPTDPVVSIGVDVASQPAGTAGCWVRWDVAGATIESVEHELDDRRLAAILAEPVAKIGLDVPLGWPDAFVEAIGDHHAVLLANLPEAAPVRLHRRTFIHDQRRTGCQRPVRDVGVPGDPTDIGRAP